MSQQQSISNVLDWKILYKKAKAARRGKWLNQIDWYILLYNCIHNFFLRYYYILKSLKLFVLGFEKIRDNIFVIFRLKVQKEIMKVTHTPRTKVNQTITASPKNSCELMNLSKVIPTNFSPWNRRIAADQGCLGFFDIMKQILTCRVNFKAWLFTSLWDKLAL